MIDFCCVADPEILPCHIFEIHCIMSSKMKIIVMCRILLVPCNYISGGQAGELTMFDQTCGGNTNFQSIISCQYGLDLASYCPAERSFLKNHEDPRSGT